MGTKQKNANIIIKLSQMGHSSTEIAKFLGFIETHNPSEAEVEAALAEAEKREK